VNDKRVTVGRLMVAGTLLVGPDAPAGAATVTVGVDGSPSAVGREAKLRPHLAQAHCGPFDVTPLRDHALKVVAPRTTGEHARSRCSPPTRKKGPPEPR